jgi:photosystem I P700 chlorophyll a apoprotein A2
MGWLRDYLWFNSSQLINGYSPLGVTKNAVWDWMFLFGHLIWAEKPVALSIVQARFVGLAHFAMGLLGTSSVELCG